MLVAVPQAVVQVHGALGLRVKAPLQHAHHRCDADSVCDEHDWYAGVGIHAEVAGWRFHFEYVALVHPVVKVYFDSSFGQRVCGRNRNCLHYRASHSLEKRAAMPSSDIRSFRSGTLPATLAIVFLIYGVIALLLLHILRPDYAPASNFISNYAVGRFGWIMTTWFLAMSAGLLALTVGLARSGLRSIVARLGMVLLVVASVGLVVSAIFPTDVAAPSTRSGEIHDMSFLVNVVSMVLAMGLLSVSFASHPAWSSYRSITWSLVALILVAFVVQFMTLHKGMPYGLANRFFVAVLVTWMLATALRTRQIALRRELEPQRVSGV